MSQVFIAYKHQDAERVANVRQKLAPLGISLFVDHQIRGGDDYLVVINAELSTALAALVFWSNAAVAAPEPGQKNFLLAEAQKGWRRDILIAATFDKIVLDNLPVPFNNMQTADLSDWFDSGMPAVHHGWQRLLDALGVKLSRPGLATLAIVLESGDADARREFLRQYPNDPIAARFLGEIVNNEKAAFEQAAASAQNRIDRRRREAEKALKECRKEFENQLAQLQAGGEFFPPDPINALGDNVAKLQDELEIYQGRIDELQFHVEESQKASEEAADHIKELRGQTEALTQERANAAAAAAISAAAVTELAKLKGEFTQKKIENGNQINKIDALQKAAKLTHEQAETTRRLIKKLQSENVALKSQLPDAPWSYRNSPRLLGAAGLLLGILLTGVITSFMSTGSAGPDADTLKRRTDEITQLQKQLNAKQVELKRSESDLSAKAGALANATAAADKRAGDLKQQSDQLVIARISTNTREKSLDERTAKIVLRERAVAERERPASAGVAAADECDTLAGARHDADRPKNDNWKKDLLDSTLSRAMSVCQIALDTAKADRKSTVEQRHLQFNLSRVYSAQSIQEAKKGNIPEAQKLFDTGIKLLMESANLGSGSAYYSLARFFLGETIVKGTAHGDFVPMQRDALQAWKYFQFSANLGDPEGLTAVAFNLLLPDWTDKLAKEDIDLGRKYLDAALKTEFPRAFYLAGAAQIEGKGVPADRLGGLRKIEFAYCKGDEQAKNYFAKYKSLKLPSCT
jgi:hypothetical protein